MGESDVFLPNRLPKGNANQELEDLLKEIDQNGFVTPESLGEPGQFLLWLYTSWKENGGLKERGKNRNSYSQMCEWLSGEKKIKSLQLKLQGTRPLNKKDGEILLDLFLEKWKFERMDGNNPIYCSFDCSDQKKLGAIVLNNLFKKESDQIKLASNNEYIGLEKNLYTIQRRIIESQYRCAKSMIIVSRNNTIVGSGPVISGNEFNKFLKMLMNEDTNTGEYFEPLIIWTVDMGARINGDISSLKAFSNICVLASKLLSFAKFDDLNCDKDYENSNIYEKISGVDTQAKITRWDWLAKKAVVIVENLRMEETAQIDMSRRFKQTVQRIPDITGQHILPSNVPELWTDSLRELYGADYAGIGDASLGIVVRKEQDDTGQEVDYYAHARIAKYKNADDAVVKTIKLRSPGNAYNTAMKLVHLAARCVLQHDINTRSEREETALNYLNLLGFHVLRLDEFIKLTMSIPNHHTTTTTEL